MTDELAKHHGDAPAATLAAAAGRRTAFLDADEHVGLPELVGATRHAHHGLQLSRERDATLHEQIGRMRQQQ